MSCTNLNSEGCSVTLRNFSKARLPHDGTAVAQYFDAS